MLELLSIMESLARFLASGEDFTLANAKRHVPLGYDEATGHVHPSGTFMIDGVLENGIGFRLTGVAQRGRLLNIWFKDGYAVGGHVAEMTPPDNKSIHPSPRDSGYAVDYDLLGMKASFLVSPAPERITLMTCEEAPPAPPSRNPEGITPFERFASLMTALQRQKVPYRLDRHGPDEVTVTFVWGSQVIEACYENGDKMWFSHFPRSPEPVDAEGVMKLIDGNCRDPEDRGRRKEPDWSAIPDPFARMLAFTRMLDEEGITWRMDSFDGRCISIFLTLVSVRVEAYTDRDGLTFAAYIGTEDVFPHEELQALVPGLSLDGARSPSH